MADQDKLCKVMALKGRIFAGLHIMSQVLPKWTLKDFVVVQRRGSQGGGGGGVDQA